jgi:hypothetical protein
MSYNLQLPRRIALRSGEAAKECSPQMQAVGWKYRKGIHGI